MLSTFKRIAKANGFKFIDTNTEVDGWAKHPQKLELFEGIRARAEKQSTQPAVFVDYHSDFPDLTLCKESCGGVGIHIVRDPRDILLSAVRFHLVSKEAWLHVRRDEFGGLTYQQKLTSYDSIEDRIRFEMDNNMMWVIRKMLSFKRQGVFRDVHYEDLIVDEDMRLWHDISLGLGMHGRELINSMDAFWQSSIFGDMKAEAQSGKNSHIKNAKPQQWRTQLSPVMLDEIQDRFGEEIVGLGYELADSASLV
jgi:hypothetical protein